MAEVFSGGLYHRFDAGPVLVGDLFLPADDGLVMGALTCGQLFKKWMWLNNQR